MSLAVLQEQATRSKTTLQQYISRKLETKRISLDTMLDNVVEIALSATTSTPTGDIVDDHKTRLNATKFLMELSGDYNKKVSGGATVNISMNDVVYSPKKNELSATDLIQDTQETVIEGS